MWEEAAWKLEGLICSVEYQMVLTVTGFPFPFKDKLFLHVSCLA